MNKTVEKHGQSFLLWAVGFKKKEPVKGSLTEKLNPGVVVTIDEEMKEEVCLCGNII